MAGVFLCLFFGSDRDDLFIVTVIMVQHFSFF